VLRGDSHLQDWNTKPFILSRIAGWLRRPQRPHATNDIPELGASIGTTTGEVRKENQDRVIAARFADQPGAYPFTLFAICDGVGGMTDGGTCAEIALASLLENLVRNPGMKMKQRLTIALRAANDDVFRRYHQRGGTTIALLCLSANERIAATVGDTRVYLVTATGPAKQVSIDDTVAGELVRLKNVDPKKLESFANELAQYIGIGPELEPRFYDLPAGAGTAYALASDGAYEIGLPTFEHILTNAPTPQIAVSRVLQVSRWIGGRDNASVIFAKTAPSPGESAQLWAVLEVWDTAAKLELFMPQEERIAARYPVPVPEPEHKPTPTRGSRTRKRPKKEARSAAPDSTAQASKRPQATLQMEFGIERTPKQAQEANTKGKTLPRPGIAEAADAGAVDDKSTETAQDRDDDGSERSDI
jgi:PPM family protein phosphatase